MEHGDDNNHVFPSQSEGTEGNQSDRTTTEGVTSLRWQREEGGRMSRHEMVTGRRTRTPTPTPHRVSAMPNTTVGIRRDSDSEEEGAPPRQGQQQQQWQNEAATAIGLTVPSSQLIDAQNQHPPVRCERRNLSPTFWH